MARKRDTNWNRDEITVLLDSIMEITRMRADDGKRTNSREVFEFAATRLGEKGHSSRAEREKCRTKWKKMKEEFNHAKKAREGDPRYKEAPGIQPFYNRMEEFINGNFDNISPHSTIVRRSSSISSSNNTTSNATTASSSSSSSASVKISPVSRSSARIAANNTPNTCPAIAVDGSATEADDLSSSTANIVPLTAGPQQQSRASINQTTPSSSRQPSSSTSSSRLSSGSESNVHINNSSNNLFPSSTVTSNNVANNGTSVNRSMPNALQGQHNSQQQNQRQSDSFSQLQQQRSSHPAHATAHQAIPNNELALNNDFNSTHNIGSNGIHASANPSVVNKSPSSNSGGQQNVSMSNHSCASAGMHSSSVNHHQHQQALSLPAEHADISYRVSSGCRQITIFGDHDVDIKFRGDCVTINKISNDYMSCSANSGATTSVVKAHGNNNNGLGLVPTSNNTTRDMEDDCP